MFGSRVQTCEALNKGLGIFGDHRAKDRFNCVTLGVV